MLQNAVFQCARKRPEVPGSARKCPEAPGSARKSARKSARSMPGSARNFVEKFAFTPPQNQFCMDFWANLCEKLLGCTNTQKISKFLKKMWMGHFDAFLNYRTRRCRNFPKCFWLSSVPDCFEVAAIVLQPFPHAGVCALVAECCVLAVSVFTFRL